MLSTNEIRQFINDIRENVKNFTYSGLVSECNKYFPSIPISVVDFTNEKFFSRQREYGGLNVVHRGREITNPQNRPHSFVSDISYIQDKDLDLIKKYGRVNKPRQSMFYGALGYHTASWETLSKGVEFRNSGSGMVTVGTWIIEQPLKLVQMPHSEKVFNALYEIVSYKPERLKLEHIKEHNEQLKRDIGNDIAYEVLELFGDAFANFDTKTDNDYFLSNYYADRIFNQIDGFKVGEEIDGIIYPSVPSSFEENNIVLKPSTVDTKLKFSSAMQVWIVHHLKTGKGAQFIPIEQRVHADENGKLLWR